MFLYQIFTVLLFFWFTIAFGMEFDEYGCKFKENYEVEIPSGQDVAWGNSSKIVPLNVGSEDGLKTFQAMIKAAKGKVFEKYPFNEIDSDLKLNNDQDNLGITLKIFNQLSDDNKNSTWAYVKKACYFAAVTLDKKPKRNLPIDDNIIGFIGLIKVMVDNEEGYIPIDYEYFVKEAPFLKSVQGTREKKGLIKEVVDNEERSIPIEDEYSVKEAPFLKSVQGTPEKEIYTARSAFLKEDITYEVINQKNIIYNAKSQELRSIYVNPPLCSIVQTADNMMDRNLIVVFAKLDKEGDMLAYILTRYPEDLVMSTTSYCKGSKARFCIGYINGTNLDEEPLESIINMSEDDEKFLKTVAGKIIDLTVEGAFEKLLNKLSDLESKLRYYVEHMWDLP